MFTSIRKIVFVIAFTGVVKFSLAQSGYLDPTFGSNGFVFTHAGNSHEYASFCTPQPDHKILVTGSTGDGYNYSAFITRYYENGKLDSTFNADGIFLYTSNLNNASVKVLVTSDEKLRLIGNTSEVSGANNKIFLTGVNNDGSGDNTFYGSVLDLQDVTHATSAALTSDGRIVIGGYSGESNLEQGLILLYDANGLPDTTFNHIGYKIAKKNNRVKSLVMQDSGRIVFVGGHDPSMADSAFLLTRMQLDGNYDLSFGDSGKVVYKNNLSLDEKVFVEPDKKLLVMLTEYADSSFDYNTHLILFTKDGLIDSSFGLNGDLQIQEFAGGDVVIQPDAKIDLAGYSYMSGETTLMQFQNNGSPDSTFGVNGTASFNNVYHWNISAYLDSLQRIILTSDIGPIVNDSSIMTVRILTQMELQTNDFTSSFFSPLIYPNPVSGDEINIRYDIPLAGDVKIDLCSTDGKRVVRLLTQNQSAGDHHQILLLPKHITSGTYLLRFMSESGIAAIHVLIDR